jgi:hypothetical protein
MKFARSCCNIKLLTFCICIFHNRVFPRSPGGRMAYNVCVCDVAGIGGQIKEVRLICPTTPKLSHETERCLKPKLLIFTSPRNVTYILLAAVACPAEPSGHKSCIFNSAFLSFEWERRKYLFKSKC